MLQLQRVVKVHPGPVAALQGIDLELPVGLFGLLGPNGSGKTTLMRIIAGLLQPTAGRVLWRGADVTRDPRPLQTRLGYLPQDVGFYPGLSGERMLVHLLQLKGITAPGGLKRLAARLLEQVNLADVARRPVRDYSGGMKRRLGIAQAIAGDPDLLIVDEPTAGLDPEERLRFQGLLAALARDRVVLLSTHLVDEVAALCPRFAVLHEGRLLADTTPSAARDKLAGRIVAGVSNPETTPDLDGPGRVLQTTYSEGRPWTRLYWRSGPPPPGFAVVPPTLEDVYLVLTRGILHPGDLR